MCLRPIPFRNHPTPRNSALSPSAWEIRQRAGQGSARAAVYLSSGSPDPKYQQQVRDGSI